MPPLWLALLVVVVVMSGITYGVYAVDKRRAGTRLRRIPESTLLLLGLLGGWPGAIVAQQRLRHKTRKVSFRRRFWSTVVVNLLVVALILALVR